jgi:hypothetical protein
MAQGRDFPGVLFRSALAFTGVHDTFTTLKSSDTTNLVTFALVFYNGHCLFLCTMLCYVIIDAPSDIDSRPKSWEYFTAFSLLLFVESWNLLLLWATGQRGGGIKGESTERVFVHEIR